MTNDPKSSAEIETCEDCGDVVTSDIQSQHLQGLCNFCERTRIDAYPEMLGHLNSIVEMAKSVSANWESGDLAFAVQNLSRIANDAELAIAKAHGKTF